MLCARAGTGKAARKNSVPAATQRHIRNPRKVKLDAIWRSLPSLLWCRAVGISIRRLEGTTGAKKESATLGPNSKGNKAALQLAFRQISAMDRSLPSLFLPVAGVAVPPSHPFDRRP